MATRAGTQGRKINRTQEFDDEPLRFYESLNYRATNETTKLLDSLKAFLTTQDYAAAYILLHQSLSAKQEDVVHDGLVLLVEQIMERKRISHDVQQIDKLQILIDQFVLDLYGIVDPDERELILTGFHDVVTPPVGVRGGGL